MKFSLQPLSSSSSLKILGLVLVISVAVFLTTLDSKEREKISLGQQLKEDHLLVAPEVPRNWSGYNFTPQQFNDSFIGLNPRSEAFKHVELVWHEPTVRAVCIEMKANATCSHPAVVGRLSGPSLAMLEFSFATKKNEKTILCGSYEHTTLVAPATYFLEIIMLFCKDFGPSALSLIPATQWVKQDFVKSCMMHPRSNHITALGSYIHIKDPVTSTNLKGSWVSKNPAASPHPLLTRYQPQNCRSSQSAKMPRCAVPMDNSSFHDYSFQWRNDQIELLQRLQESYSSQPSMIKTNNPCDTCDTGKCKMVCVLERQDLIANMTSTGQKKICLVGASHSYHIAFSLHMSLGLGQEFLWIQTRFPTEVDHDFLSQHASACSKFLLSLGQWPASYWHPSTNGRPWLFAKFYKETKRIIALVNRMSMEMPDFPQVYFRNMHHMPIGDRTGRCRPSDWRSPSVVDGYNHVVRKAIADQEKTGTLDSSMVRYLDTSFITRPLWDSAYDWCHLPPQVSDVEAIYIASMLLLQH